MSDDEFDIHSDDNVSLEVPAEILPQIKEYHQVRARLLRKVRETNEEFLAAQEKYRVAYVSINNELDAATIKARDICVKAKLVGEAELFFLDTSRVMKHDRAYVIKPPADGTEPKNSSTVH